MSAQEREKLLQIDYFDYKNATTREKMIFEAETLLWHEKLQKCKEMNPMHGNYACQWLQDIVDERTAYENSQFASGMAPKTTPALPDLGPKPTKKSYMLE